MTVKELREALMEAEDSAEVLMHYAIDSRPPREVRDVIVNGDEAIVLSDMPRSPHD